MLLSAKGIVGQVRIIIRCVRGRVFNHSSNLVGLIYNLPTTSIRSGLLERKGDGKGNPR